MIPLTRPVIEFDDVAEDLKAIFASGVLTRGEYVRRFEEAVARYVGTRHAVATTSATTALHMALVAAGVGSGDEVLVSDFTFPATGNVVVHCGAVPVFVDCLPDSFLSDLDHAAALMTPRTRAILLVDPFGQPADLDGAAALADRHGLVLVEDAACALGAGRGDRRCGSWPMAGCFSFHPRKVITTGEGGMITTDDDELFARLDLLRNHGGSPGAVGMVFRLNGFNYRMSEIQAALGLAQMARLDDLVAGRQAGAAAYLERLADVAEVRVPIPADGHCTFQSFVVLLDDTIDRDAVVRGMRARGVETTLGTYAAHAHPAFAPFGYAAGDLPRSWRAERQSLTLPLWPGMPEGVVDQVVDALAACLRRPA